MAKSSVTKVRHEGSYVTSGRILVGTTAGKTTWGVEHLVRGRRVKGDEYRTQKDAKANLTADRKRLASQIRTARKASTDSLIMGRRYNSGADVALVSRQNRQHRVAAGNPRGGQFTK